MKVTISLNRDLIEKVRNIAASAIQPWQRWWARTWKRAGRWVRRTWESEATTWGAGTQLPKSSVQHGKKDLEARGLVWAAL